MSISRAKVSTAAVEVIFRMKQSQEETYAVLPASLKLAIIYQLLCNGEYIFTSRQAKKAPNQKN